MRTKLLPGSLALLALAAGCSDEKAEPQGAGDAGGTVVIATAADPNTLLPPLITGTEGQAVTALLFDRLAEIGDSLNPVGDVGFRPRLASRWSWSRDSMQIAFHLDPKARWHDGKPVRAADVRFTFGTYVSPAVASPFAPLLANIDSVVARDSLTAVFYYKRRTPQQFFDAAYQLAILPAHLLGSVAPAKLREAPFAREPVGTGRFRFAKWEPGARLELVADVDNYRGRPKLDRVVWSIAPDYGAAVIKLFAGEADFFETLRPENLDEAGRRKELRLAPYPTLDYNFLQFNLRSRDGRAAHPVFGDRQVRRAISMIVDRERLVRSVFDSLALPGLGPFPRATFTPDASLRQIAHNPAGGRALLDSLGWRDADGDGILEKGGRQLAFSLLVPTSSSYRMRYGVLLQEQLRLAGVRVNVEPMEINAVKQRMGDRDFDAFLGGWHTDPSPGGVRQTWGSAGARKGGSNFGSYVNPVFDAYVDSALTALDPARSRQYWHRAFQTIIDDAPAVWLYEPRLVAGAHRRVRLTGLRADGWWAGIPEWSIPADQRIARDRAGARGVGR